MSTVNRQESDHSPGNARNHRRDSRLADEKPPSIPHAGATPTGHCRKRRGLTFQLPARHVPVIRFGARQVQPRPRMSASCRAHACAVPCTGHTSTIDIRTSLRRSRSDQKNEDRKECLGCRPKVQGRQQVPARPPIKSPVLSAGAARRQKMKNAQPAKHSRLPRSRYPCKLGLRPPDLRSTFRHRQEPQIARHQIGRARSHECIGVFPVCWALRHGLCHFHSRCLPLVVPSFQNSVRRRLADSLIPNMAVMLCKCDSQDCWSEAAPGGTLHNRSGSGHGSGPIETRSRFRDVSVFF